MNEASSPGVYDKAGSLLEIRSSDDAAESVRRRLSAYHDSLLAAPVPGPRGELLLAACRDLLGVNSSPQLKIRPLVIEELGRLDDSQIGRYLYFRYRYDIYPDAYIIDDAPPCVQIEVSSVCNYRCVFCYQTDKSFTHRPNGFMGKMTLDLFKSVVDQLDGKVDAVTLASRGEPLSAPDIVQMLEYMGDKFLALKLNTNASLLDERKSHAILQSGIRTLVFSVDSAGDPLYGSLRVGGKFETISRNIKQFAEIRRRHYPESRLVTRISGVKYSDAQDLDEIQAYWRDDVDQVAFVEYCPWENIYDNSPNGLTKACSELWRRMFVFWDGSVGVCGDPDFKGTIKPGMVHETPIMDIWRGPVYEDLRQRHLDGRRQGISPCSGCPVT